MIIRFKLKEQERKYYKQPLDEMAEICTVNNVLYLYIRINDAGNVPHFHFRDLSCSDREIRSGKADGTIKLLEPEYFPHGGKYEKKLKNSQIKELIKFLNKPFTKFKRFTGTNWEYIVSMWNGNNSVMNIDEDTPMPDYTKLNV